MSDPHPGDVEMEELSAVLAAVPSTVTLIALDGTIRFVNRTAGGLDHEDVVGRDMLEFLPDDPELRQRQTQMFERVIETGEAGSYEVPIPGPDGETTWFEGTLTPLVHDGRVTAVIAVSTDVTVRRRAEEEANKLRKLLPVCSWCRRIQSDEGEWQELETYMTEGSDTRVSHGICPDCQDEMSGANEYGERNSA